MTFLILHEICHILFDEGVPQDLAEHELNIDIAALGILSVLARAELPTADPAFALLGAQLTLLALACAEWSFFLARPQTHPDSLSRLVNINTSALQNHWFPPGSVLWSAEVMKPLRLLVTEMGIPLLPMIEGPVINDDEQTWFQPEGVPQGSEKRMTLADYERLDYHLNFPVAEQMRILCRQVGIFDIDDESAGIAYCQDKYKDAIARLSRQAQAGLSFRGAIEGMGPQMKEVPYSERIASLSWMLHELGWDEMDVLVPRWLPEDELIRRPEER